jgi:hypothetical protein
MCFHLLLLLHHLFLKILMYRLFEILYLNLLMLLHH